MLVLYGVGLTVGNWLGGRFADRSDDGTLVVTLAALTVMARARCMLGGQKMIGGFYAKQTFGSRRPNGWVWSTRALPVVES